MSRPVSLGSKHHAGSAAQGHVTHLRYQALPTDPTPEEELFTPDAIVLTYQHSVVQRYHN